LARRFWKRRAILISAGIVALSLGIVFASLPYLQPQPAPHGSIQQTYSHAVASATPNGPGNFGLSLPIAASEPFAVNVTIVNGAASFCVMADQIYRPWASSYNLSSAGPFPSSSCTFGPTGQMSHGILNFGVTPGTWDIVALNYSGSSEITVYYSPA
jgi:hypothetical protein